MRGRHRVPSRGRWAGDRRTIVFNIGARVGALISLGLATVVVARTGGPSAVGLLALLRVLPGLVGVLVSCGLPSATPYFLSSRADPTLRATIVWLTCVAAVLAALVWLVVSPVLHRVFFPQQSLALVAWCAVAVFTQLLVAVGKSLLQGSDDLRGANLAIFAEEAAFLPAFLALITVLHGSVLLLVALVAADVLVAGGILVRLARRRFFAEWTAPDVGLAREITVYGLRGQVGGVLLLLNLRFDFALLGALAGPAVLGIYAIASKYAELLRLPGLAVTYVLYPRFTKQGPEVARNRTQELLPRAAGLTVLAAIPLIALAGPLLPALYGAQFRPAIVPAWILIAGLAGEGAAGLVTAYLYAIRRPGLNSLAMGAGVVTTIVLDVLLIGRYGAVGAAIASTAAYLLTTAVLLTMFARLRHRSVPVDPVPVDPVPVDPVPVDPVPVDPVPVEAMRTEQPQWAERGGSEARSEEFVTARADRAETPARARRGRWFAVATALGSVAALVGVLVVVLPDSVTDAKTVERAAAARGNTAPIPDSRSKIGLSPVAAYQQAADIAGKDGLRVWLEADLVKRWLAGPAAFEAGVQRLATLAREPGVVGFKVADELGYGDGLTSSAQILRFLHDTASALRRVAPGKKILVDMIVPELGCLPGLVPGRIWASVAAVQDRGRYPQLALSQVDKYVRSRTIDVLDISSGLRDERTYAGWGSDRDTAQLLAWREIQRRGWSSLLTVQGRKALAGADGYAGSATQAAADLRTWIDIPAQDGARAVDVWTWAQHYRGQTFALLGPALAPNPLWHGLLERRARGLVLFTHFTPSVTRQSVTVDLARLATVFTDVFVATGTG